MSSPQNNDPPSEPAVIPLADAPRPHPAAAAPGETAPAPPADSFVRDPLTSLTFQPQIVEAVSKVFDPEIPVNIYELGLIYDMDVDSANNVRIRMTLTAPACPAAQTIPIDVERRVREVEGLNDVKVEVVWDPPWTRDRMSDAAKLSLGML
jgi:FeS assembly SUF system protein